MTTTDRSQLGRPNEYPSHYSPDLLFAIPRAETRDALDIGRAQPFHGRDVWHAFELTWLDSNGKPAIATARIVVDANSPNLVESKSLKLYLNSLAMERYASAEDVRRLVASDLGNAAGDGVSVEIFVGPQPDGAAVGDLPGRCIDDLEIDAVYDGVDASVIKTAGDDVVAETLHSHLLRSNCPVTNQPDIGSVLIRYEGTRIDAASLLAYIVSYRSHSGFHEACVERMFVDLKKRARPGKLTVHAHFNRRGGLDINPFRSDFEPLPDDIRLWRQ